jgi:hypothetical protein
LLSFVCTVNVARSVSFVTISTVHLSFTIKLLSHLYIYIYIYPYQLPSLAIPSWLVLTLSSVSSLCNFYTLHSHLVILLLLTQPWIGM